MKSTINSTAGTSTIDSTAGTSIVVCLWLGLCLWLAASSSLAAASCDDPRPLRLALTPIKNSETQLAQYRPLLGRLEKMTGRRVVVVPTPSYGTAIEGLLADGIDLAELGPASYAIAMSRGARISAFATFALRRGPHTESASTYRSLLVVRRDQGVASIEGLRGRTLALTDPASTSGAILPRQAIARLTGVAVESYFMRVVFAGSHDRAIDAVQKGLVDAAFVASSRLDEALRRGTTGPEELAILWQSSPIPYDPFVISDRLCPALAAKIRQVFLGDTRSLAAMFEDLHMTGFVPTSDEPYRELRELFSAPR